MGWADARGVFTFSNFGGGVKHDAGRVAWLPRQGCEIVKLARMLERGLRLSYGP
jgi:hypothetical protein